MNNGLRSGWAKHNRDASDVSQGTEGLLFLQARYDAQNAIQIQQPDSGWGFDTGAQPTYGTGQAIMHYKAGSGTPIGQILFRVDGGSGGVGTAGGVHSAMNLTGQMPNVTQNMWADNSSAPPGCAGLVITGNLAQTADYLLLENPHGTLLWRWTPVNSGQDINLAVLDHNGANPLYFDPQPTTSFGFRFLVSTISAANGGIDIGGPTGQTANLIQCTINNAVVWQLIPSGQVKSAAANEATGAGTPSFGSNCPAATLTAVNTWLKFTKSDGSQLYVPAWK